jgi:uncharacterized membrane protein YraQ (UPF0718 family)
MPAALLALALGHELVRALSFAFGMFWEILWALILGFTLSGGVQAVVSKEEMRRLLPDDSPRTLAISAGLGAASSSCSYAAVALARSLFRKGADFTAAMAFQFASTNLVFELGIVMAILLGWQFVVGEFVGGPLMIILLAIIFRLFLSKQLVDGPRASGEGRAGLHGGACGHGHGRQETGHNLAAAAQSRGLYGHGHLLCDGLGGDLARHWRRPLDRRRARRLGTALLVAIALPRPPHDRGKVLGPIIGPLVAIISFVCSVGNVPLAAVLWNGGISFGGVLAFIFADLIVLPILDIYRRYYGWRMAGFLLAAFYATMVAGLIVEFLFQGLGIERTARNAKVIEASVRWNYDTVLNILFLALAATLLWRYFHRGGGLAMLRTMNKPIDETEHVHAGAHAHQPRKRRVFAGALEARQLCVR